MPHKITDNNTLTFNEYYLPTPLGKLNIWLSADNILQFVGWEEFHDETLHQLKNYYSIKEINLQKINNTPTPIQAIADYFNGNIKAIDSLAVASFGTSFQQQVWQKLRTIPAGTTSTYGELAKQIGKPLASRAVGMANHCNPIAIVVPCHRVIGKNKKLTGYAGGLERKQWLLDHEQHYSSSIKPLFH